MGLNQNLNSFYSDPKFTIVVSFNGGTDAINNIDTKVLAFSFTMRYYDVSQKVFDGKFTPEKTVK